MKDSKRKVVVITGGLGYVGFGIAEKFAEELYHVMVLHRNENEEEVVARIGKLVGDGHRAFFCDLSDEVNVDTVLGLITKEYGQIDVVVHCAGVRGARKALLQNTAAELREQLESNTVNSFIFLTLCAKKMKLAKTGIIIGVTTSGVVSASDTKMLGSYIVSKYALQGVLVMLREELKDFGVHVYSVAPSFMHGGMNSDIPHAFAQMIQEKNNRTVTSLDVAQKVIEICASPEKFSEATTIVV